MPRSHDHQEPPCGVIILKQLGKREWIFECPRIGETAQDDLGVGIDWMGHNDRRAKSIFRGLIADYPEFLDAHYHLGLTLYREGKRSGAARVWKKGAELALKFLPPDFSIRDNRLQWGCYGNRPFLRLYLGYALALRTEGRTEEALGIYQDLLALNPNDNQGARGLAASCYFELGRPEGVLELSGRFKDDGTEELVYGRPLALFQVSRIKEAARALRIAFRYLPLIAKELLKRTHRRPRDWSEDRITVGGRDQAYAYWQGSGRFWEKTPGALAFLKECLERDET